MHFLFDCRYCCLLLSECLPSKKADARHHTGRGQAFGREPETVSPPNAIFPRKSRSPPMVRCSRPRMEQALSPNPTANSVRRIVPGSASNESIFGEAEIPPGPAPALRKTTKKTKKTATSWARSAEFSIIRAVRAPPPGPTLTLHRGPTCPDLSKQACEIVGRPRRRSGCLAKRTQPALCRLNWTQARRRSVKVIWHHYTHGLKACPKRKQGRLFNNFALVGPLN